MIHIGSSCGDGSRNGSKKFMSNNIPYSSKLKKKKITGISVMLSRGHFCVVGRGLHDPCKK